MPSKPSKSVERVRLLVASPGDVEAERNHVSALADELNRGVAQRQGLALEVVRWETHVRPDLGRTQQIVFDQIGQVDIVVLVMWRRFGTPTGVAGSGTEEEFNWCLKLWQDTGAPQVLCYFSEAPIPPPSNAAEAEQLLQVAKFRERVNGLGLCCTYDSDARFKELLREHLQSLLMSRFGDREPVLDRNLQQLLDAEKARCRTNDAGFATPNLLKALLSIASIKEIFEKACPGKLEPILGGLRQYRAPGPFADFEWTDRPDVAAARRRAKAEDRSAIEAHHLLLGFLETESETRAELERSVGKEALDRLQRGAEQRSRPKKTVGVGGLFRRADGNEADDAKP